MKRGALMAAAAMTLMTAACAQPRSGALLGTHADGSPRRAALEVEAAWEGKSSSDFAGGVVPGGLIIEPIDYNDAHDSAHRLGLRGSIELDPRTEVSAGVSYAQAESRDWITVGTAITDPIEARFDDYERVSVEVGLRRYVGEESTLWHPSLRPFVGGSIGVSQIAEIDAEFRSDGFEDLGIAPEFSAEFYDESYVLTASATLGAQWRVHDHAAIEIETGLRYDGAPDEDDTSLSVINLDIINDASDGRVVIPVTLRGRMRF